MTTWEALFRREVVEALLRTYSERIPYIRTHAERVSEYARRLAEHLGWPPEEVEQVREAALLCDLGQVAVSDLILAKPDRLTEDEWEMMKRHPVLGAEIVGAITLLRPLSIPIRHHHERYDGTGYPDALRGEDIPLESRLLALCDAYDALLSERPYRPPLSPEEAQAVLRENAGTQFDPHLTEAFLTLLQSQRKV
ncbi:MAG TPA: HD-GYP domain-containing protein [Armatimonadetes bacterium]|nr:HD-GYP domain-containing protein [Armatimonadota bacterium]